MSPIGHIHSILSAPFLDPFQREKAQLRFLLANAVGKLSVETEAVEIESKLVELEPFSRRSSEFPTHKSHHVCRFPRFATSHRESITTSNETLLFLKTMNMVGDFSFYCHSDRVSRLRVAMTSSAYLSSGTRVTSILESQFSLQLVMDFRQRRFKGISYLTAEIAEISESHTYYCIN